MITTDPQTAIEAYLSGVQFVLFNGDCRDILSKLPSGVASLAISSPPYFLGKSFDTSRDLKDFRDLHKAILPAIDRAVEAGGNMCWQVGHHVNRGIVSPLDYTVHELVSGSTGFQLRNRLIWTFGHGAHSKRRFSGRHETVMWYSKGDDYYFDLDASRVPQKYRGKKHYKGPRKGEWSSHPGGKNPGDVWDIPNVKSNHVEKTHHPCQFPIALAQRLIKTLCKPKGLVLDPFAGVASAGIAAAIEGRSFLGAELDMSYCEAGEVRYQAVLNETIKFRPIDKPVYVPNPRSSVARDPFLPIVELVV